MGRIAGRNTAEIACEIQLALLEKGQEEFLEEYHEKFMGKSLDKTSWIKISGGITG